MDDKAALRSSLRHRRRLLLPAAEASLQAHACRCLPALLSGGQRLGLYWPLRGEADLRPLAERPALSQRLALPKVSDGQLHYCAWSLSDPLQPDATGIPSPQQGPHLNPEQLGILLAPALAFDANGIRLGYGGGWFDRLRSDPAWRAVPALAVLPAGCLMEVLPQDPWDVPFDGWLDEQGIHWLQAV
jgi:5-formyltetrahydrofolate cyclo-ligase